MPACELIYLSSCESGATTNLLLTDEGLSIAGAFHMVNVPHAVSRMWQLSDTVAPEVAADFFRELRGENGQIDVERTACGLHASIQKQRDKGTHPVFWGSFIHTGC